MADVTTADEHAIPDTPGETYLNYDKSILSWIFTLDHKRIAIMYAVSIGTAMILGGIFALLLRTELLTPASGLLMSNEQYNHAFTLHGAVMIFLVIIPGIPAIFGNFVLPLMLGAKDVAFPRLNLMSYHFYVIGLVFFLLTLMTGGLDTGWTFYTPYSSSVSQGNVPFALFGAFILGFSSIFTGLNFVVTIHKLRPPGMGWFNMPLFLWAIYATGIIQILATPVLGITLLMLIVERTVGIGVFDPALGGDPVLFQHFFWFYSHPAVYIMILPPMGVMSELIAVNSHKHIFGYKFIAYSSLAIAFISFVVWGHHMFTSGQSPMASAIFSILTMTVAIPTAVKIFNWLATMYKGSITFDAPMLYALAFLFIFAIGGLTGLFLGTINVDIHLHDTYFVVAHFHYVMMGSALMALIGGFHHWWPKITGRMYPQKTAQTCAVLLFIGFNLAFFPMFIAGSQGMPRRYANYDPVFQMNNIASTIGAFLMGAVLFVILFYMLASLKRGKKAPANPWGGASFEWMTASPPPHYNFDTPPKMHDPYDFHLFEYVSEEAGYKYLPDPDAEWTQDGSSHDPNAEWLKQQKGEPS